MLARAASAAIAALVLFCPPVPLFAQEPPAAGTPAPAAPPPESKELRVWAGLSQYRMSDFNRKLDLEGNRSIGPGFSIGVEVSLLEVRVPVGGASLKIPVGMEYLAASSTTTHTSGTANTTVTWNLPSVGVFIAPTFSVPFGRPGDPVPANAEARHEFYLHPGVGYYFANRWARAKLTISDRPGHLEAEGAAPGAFLAVGVALRLRDRGRLFAEGGYRHLRFADVEVTPVGGFPESAGGAAVQIGNLTEPLDYSGGFIRLGWGLRF